jgi:hypothetical protein
MNLCYYYPLNDGDRCKIFIYIYIFIYVYIYMYMSKKTHYIEYKRLKEPDTFQKP